MTKRPRWRATKTRRQSRNLAILWGILAIVWWLLLVPAGSTWWQWVTGAAWTVLAISYFVSWRLWRPEWNGS